MSKWNPKEAKEKLNQEKDKICFVDVRSTSEFLSGHIPGAQCIPLDQIESGTASLPRDKVVLLSCQSGARSARAKALLDKLGYSNVVELEGGFSAWNNLGLPVIRQRKVIPVIRQVLLTAGALILLSSILGFVIDPRFFYIPAFIGAGLSFAGLTGWCGMAFLLERMPWNRV